MGKIVTQVTRKLQLFVTGRVAKNGDLVQKLQKLHIFLAWEKINNIYAHMHAYILLLVQYNIFVTCNFICATTLNSLKLNNLRRLQ